MGVDLHVYIFSAPNNQRTGFLVPVQMLFPSEMVHLGECHKVEGKHEMTHGAHGGAIARLLWCFSVPDIFGFPSFHLFWELLYILSVTPFSP